MNEDQNILHPPAVGQESPDSCATTTVSGCLDKKEKARIRGAAWYRKNRELTKARAKAHYESHKAERKVSGRAYYFRNIEKVKSRARKYHDTHREERRRYVSQYAAENKDKLKAYLADYYEKNADVIKARTIQWMLEHKDEIKAHHKAHPEIQRSYVHKRRALKMKGAIGNQKVITEWEGRWRAAASVNCYWCLESFSPSDCHADHIVALSKGGSHSIENLCISCSSCNQIKNAATLERWNKRLTHPVLL